MRCRWRSARALPVNEPNNVQNRPLPNPLNALAQARAVALKRGFGPAGQALCRQPELDALALGAAQQAALELAAEEGEAEAQQGSQQAQQQVHAR